MFDLFWLSTSDDRVVENADWVEIKTLFHSDGTVSREDLARALYRAAYEEEPSASDELAEEDADHTHYRAETYSEQRAREMAEDVFRELEDRERSCAGAPDSSPNSYPFELIEDSVI